MRQRLDGLINSPIKSNCREIHKRHIRGLTTTNEASELIPNDHLILGETALTVQRIVPSNEYMVIATASGSAVKNGWIKLIKLGRRKLFQEDLDRDISTGYFLPLLVS
jgi:hypothetical protein